MKKSLTALAIIACALILFFAGCTSNKQYRTSYTPCNPALGGTNSTITAIETNSDYKLGFVEFDDQGWFWATNQVRHVEQMVQTEAGIGQTNNTNGIVIVLFVHGWKDNAEYDNDGVVAFRSILEQLNKAEQVQTNHPARRVVGVYAGWRGLSAELEPFKELSFWERKNTAHKVGGYGAMAQLMVELESVQQDSNNSLATNILATTASQTELIIIGHSFGGAAVYTAISEIVTERYVDTVERGEPLKPLGDQVILLNPAFEASRFYDLYQMAISTGLYPTNQRPVLSIFTSKGDWATHYAFPVGRFFSTVFEDNRNSKQRAADRDAVGWYDTFVTHDLYYKTNASTMTNSTYNWKTKKHEFHDWKHMRISMENVRAQRKLWHSNATNSVTYLFDDSILSPRPGYHEGDPFLIVSVDKQIMKDHGDIANPVLINFLGEYISFCRADPQEPPRKVTSSHDR